jgi:DNA-binding response OmpR family regulator
MDELPTILVIEDEELIQAMVDEALIEGGFATEIVVSGEEALKLVEGGLKDYKALVTDIGLKGEVTGWEVAAKARESHPTLPIVYMSGAHADEWTSKGVPNSIMIAKPFAPAQLVTAVANLLNAAAPT